MVPSTPYPPLTTFYHHGALLISHETCFLKSQSRAIALSNIYIFKFGQAPWQHCCQFWSDRTNLNDTSRAFKILRDLKMIVSETTTGYHPDNNYRQLWHALWLLNEWIASITGRFFFSVIHATILVIKCNFENWQGLNDGNAKFPPDMTRDHFAGVNSIIFHPRH